MDLMVSWALHSGDDLRLYKIYCIVFFSDSFSYKEIFGYKKKLAVENDSRTVCSTEFDR